MLPGVKLNCTHGLRLSKVTEDSNRCTGEFNIIIQTYQPGFSDLYQLIRSLVSKDQAQYWMEAANWGKSHHNHETSLLTCYMNRPRQ